LNSIRSSELVKTENQEWLPGNEKAEYPGSHMLTEHLQLLAQAARSYCSA